jgi:hypothetical protein
MHEGWKSWKNQEEHCSLEVKQNVIENYKSIVVKSDVRGLKRIADENIFVKNFDRKNENVDLSYEHDQTPVIAKLDPKPDRKRDAENRKKEDDGGRIGRKKMMVGGRKKKKIFCHTQAQGQTPTENRKSEHQGA